MSGSVDKMVLCCPYCNEEQDDDTVLEAVLLHMQVAHDTDEVHLDLRAKCRCGMLMEQTNVGTTSTLCQFRCPTGHVGSMRMKL